MKNPKNIFIENVLSKKECDSLKEAAFRTVLHDGKIMSAIEAFGIVDTSVGNNNKSIYAPYLNLNVAVKPDFTRLTQIVQSYYPEKLIYNHAYLRTYYNGSELLIHADKKDLDVTLTVNVDGLQDWAIHISNMYNTYEQEPEDERVLQFFKESYETYFTPKGSGVCCYGRHFPHWRDKLVCEEDEYVMQIFFHWKFAP